MKTKEEILQSFYTTGNDGMPEISASHLLEAMEAYKQQSLEETFSAARKIADGSMSGDNFMFATFEDYIKSTQVVIPKREADELNEAVALVADSILPNFLPSDNTVTELSFNFNMQGNTYTAFYKKDANGYWQLFSWE